MKRNQSVSDRSNPTIQYLADLVAMRTTLRNHTAANEALDYIERHLATRGMIIARYEWNDFGSLVATTRATKTPTVMLVGHLDVVAGHTDHFALTKAGDKLQGRGVCDMKFAIAAYLQLVDALQNDLSKYDFGIMLTSDEEVGGYNGALRLLEEGYRPKVCVIPDGGENWHLETFAKGVVLAELTVAGKPGHGSRPWEADSASVKLVRLLHELTSLFAEQGPDTATINIGHIESGLRSTRVPDKATAYMDIRFPDWESCHDIKAKLDQLLPQYDATWNHWDADPPCINDPNDPYIQTFCQLVAETTGAVPKESHSFGASDGRFFSDVGIPCIIMLPPGGGHHTDHEWLSASGLMQYEVVLRQFIDKVARKSSS